MYDAMYDSKRICDFIIPSDSNHYAQCEGQVKLYLNGQTDRIRFKSIAEVYAIFSIFRKHFLFDNMTRSCFDMPRESEKNKTTNDEKYGNKAVFSLSSILDHCDMHPRENDQEYDPVSLHYINNLRDVKTKIMQCKILAKRERVAANKMIEKIKKEKLNFVTTSRVEQDVLSRDKRIKKNKRQYRLHARNLEKYRGKIHYLNMNLNLQKKHFYQNFSNLIDKI